MSNSLPLLKQYIFPSYTDILNTKLVDHSAKSISYFYIYVSILYLYLPHTFCEKFWAFEFLSVHRSTHKIAWDLSIVFSTLMFPSSCGINVFFLFQKLLVRGSKHKTIITFHPSTLLQFITLTLQRNRLRYVCHTVYFSVT